MAELNNDNQTTSSIDLKTILDLYLNKWYYFAISVAVALIIGALVYLSTTPMYERSMQVLVKSDTKTAGGIMGDIENIGTFGNFGGNMEVANEILAFSSNDLVAEVVNRMHLYMEYSEKGLFHDRVLYGEDLPVCVKLPDIEKEQDATFSLAVKKDGSVELSKFVLYDKGDVIVESNDEVKTHIGNTVKTPIGNVNILPGAPIKEEQTILVTKSSLTSTIKAYKKLLSATRVDKQADVIQLSITDKSNRRGDDILDTLIAAYNELWIKNKNQIAVSTSEFINNRLEVIVNELSGVDADISNYKSANMVPDVKTAANLYMTESSTLNTQITEVNNQLYIAQYIRSYLVDKSNITNPIPAISGVTNASVDKQIAEYNEQILRRNNLAAQSSEKNSLVISADRMLETMRQSIIASMDNNIYALNSQLKNLKQNEAKINARISSNPAMAKQLLSVERQQTVKEALYLYLLQKREENELSQAFTAYNTRIIEHPTGSNIPKSPRRNRILLVAIFVGLAIPGGLLFANETMNTKVRSRKDLETLSAPLIGEIPEIESKENRKLINRIKKRISRIRPQKSTQSTPPTPIVREGKRDVLNEAFRVLRTNLEYISKGDGCTVYQMTSFNAGSGKSFISLNIGLCLALKRKRVLLVDGDMRHATTSACINSPKKGLSNYLNNQIELDNINEVIYKYAEGSTLDVLPVGKIPPNPSELIGNGRLSELIKRMRQQYDYIFLDCPPVDIVADTQIVANDVDRSIFVIRAGLLERDMIPEVQKLYESDKLKNIVVLLNGSNYVGGKYYYGKRYGYGYGYKSYYNNTYYTSNE